MLLSEMADQLEGLAGIHGGNGTARVLKLAAAVLRRRARETGDEICPTCGGGTHEPCGDEIPGCWTGTPLSARIEADEERAPHDHGARPAHRPRWPGPTAGVRGA